MSLEVLQCHYIVVTESLPESLKVLLISTDLRGKAKMGMEEDEKDSFGSGSRTTQKREEPDGLGGISKRHLSANLQIWH